MRRAPQLPRLVAELYGTTTAGDCAAVLRLLAARSELVRGAAIAEYERAFARRIDVEHAISFASGRVAFYALLRGLGVGAGDDVLLQLPTHVVVVNAIRYTGARPVFVDCDPATFNIDLADAERRATARSKVLVLQHTFGIPVDMDAAQSLARRRGLIVIEDCVHALGATYGGRPVGSLGRAAFFSTEETKTISSTMGGVAVTSDAGLAGRVRAFQASCEWPPALNVARYLLKLIVYHACTTPLLHPYVRPLYTLLGRSDWTRLAPAATARTEQRGDLPSGYAVRLSNAQAAIALRQLRRLDENVGHRRTTAAAYRKRLEALGFELPQPPPAANPAYVRYPVRVRDREAATRAAASRAVLGGWFSAVIGEARSPADVGYQRGTCPQAEAVAGHLVNLPTHQRVGAADVEAIVDALASVARVR
jgi:dTDP-4-amino-4,6-dideoxygalactose transaminase